MLGVEISQDSCLHASFHCFNNVSWTDHALLASVVLVEVESAEFFSKCLCFLMSDDGSVRDSDSIGANSSKVVTAHEFLGRAPV